MSKNRMSGQAKAAKGAPADPIPDTLIPPIYFTRPVKEPLSPVPDPPRGALTDEMEIAPAFTKLILEGQAGLYLLLDRARRHIPRKYPIIRDKERKRPRPGLLLIERDGALGYDPNRSANGRMVRDPYGATFYRTDRKATGDEMYQLWIKEFAAEVEVCVERFKEHEELPTELARMIAAFRAFEIGSGEAAPYIADLRKTGSGQSIMRTMDEGKARLLRRLDQLRKALSSPVAPRTNLKDPSMDSMATSLTNTFTKLLTEGKASQYPLLASSFLPLWAETPGLIETSMWSEFMAEFNGMNGKPLGISDDDILGVLNGAWIGPVSMSPTQQHSERLRKFSEWIIQVNSEMQCGTPSIRQSFTSHNVPPSDRYDQWIEAFVTKVDKQLVQFKEHGDLPNELGQLIASLRDFEIGSGPAASFVKALRETGIADPIMDMVNGGKRRLLMRLEKKKSNLIPSATAKAPKPNGWPDLKTIALFRALRFETGDRTADLTQANAQQVAIEAGRTAKSSGKELRQHFHRYASAKNRVVERTGDSKRPGDIEKRYEAVIAMLGSWPAALALAQSERIIVRNRSQGIED